MKWAEHLENMEKQRKVHKVWFKCTKVNITWEEIDT
jgi:hypothetical protein